jgi:hypothetical protein
MHAIATTEAIATIENEEQIEVVQATQVAPSVEIETAQVKPAGKWQRLCTQLRQWIEEPGDHHGGHHGGDGDDNGDGGDDDELDGDLTLRGLAPTPLHFGYDGADTFLATMLEEAVIYAEEARRL